MGVKMCACACECVRAYVYMCMYSSGCICMCTRVCGRTKGAALARRRSWRYRATAVICKALADVEIMSEHEAYRMRVAFVKAEPAAVTTIVSAILTIVARQINGARLLL